MRKTIVLGLSALLLSACTGTKQSSESATIALPVSEKQLCLDWYTAYSESFPEDFWSNDEDESLPVPDRYIVTDLDHDGLAEVLVQGKDTNNAALLSYDKEGKVKFTDVTNDGYLCLGIGDGWYVREFDDHMNEYRTWTRYYYKVTNGEFDYIGEKSFGFDGVGDDGEYINKEEDATGGQAPANDQITMYDFLTDWQTISDDAKADANTVLADGEGCDNTDDCECDTPEDQFFACEVKLDDGTRMRLDYKVDTNDHIAGFTTYYRSNGKTSKIPFFGTHFYDRFVNQDFLNVYEYYNGKCCGHMLWSLSEDNELSSGTWTLRDRKLGFESYEVKSPDTEAEYTSPSLDFKLADQLLPCDRQTLRDLFAKAYPESGPANYFMMVDMDSNGVFEIFVCNGFGSAPKTALVWMENGQPQVMGFGPNHQLMLHFADMFVTSDEGQTLYHWSDGKPVKDTDADADRLQFLADYSQDLTAMGEWLSM